MVSKRGKNSASKSQNEEFHDDREEFDKLCRELNMDIETADAAWNSYTDVKDKYTLEVRFHNSKFENQTNLAICQEAMFRHCIDLTQKNVKKNFEYKTLEYFRELYYIGWLVLYMWLAEIPLYQRLVMLQPLFKAMEYHCQDC